MIFFCRQGQIQVRRTTTEHQTTTSVADELVSESADGLVYLNNVDLSRGSSNTKYHIVYKTEKKTERRNKEKRQ